MILAGGKGERLHPLTLHRAKPAVPFGGKYRIIDFTLSNCINSNIRKVAILTQYKSLSLDKHIRMGWDIVNPELGDFIISLPPQQRISQEWYRGTADAIFQNLYMIEHEATEHLLVLSGDHVYKMDYSEMYQFHLQKKAKATIAVIEMKHEKTHQFGIAEGNPSSQVIGFREKPPPGSDTPRNSDTVFVSMGVYLFHTQTLISYLQKDALRNTEHDFGKNIIPEMVKDGLVYAYNFRDENKKEAKYWRDIGTLDAYWEANLDLVSVEPHFNLYDRDWPLRTYQGQHPPAKFVFAEEFHGGRLGIALDSIVCGGCIISGGKVQNSVLSPDVRVESYAEVKDSVIMEDVQIGKHCAIKRAIIDKGIIIPPKTEIGYDLGRDCKRFFVTESNLVVVSKGMKVE